MKILLEMPISLYFSRPLNVAFHNLCNNPKDCPKFLKSLLGLGLNFIPTPQYCNHKNIDGDRFMKDLYTRCFFQGTPSKPTPKLFIRSSWTPPRPDIPIEYRVRIDEFLKSIKQKSPPKSSGSNLLPIQRTTLYNLRNNSNLVIFPTDKNLGPAIIDKKLISNELSLIICQTQLPIGNYPLTLRNHAPRQSAELLKPSSKNISIKNTQIVSI